MYDKRPSKNLKNKDKKKIVVKYMNGKLIFKACLNRKG